MNIQNNIPQPSSANMGTQASFIDECWSYASRCRPGQNGDADGTPSDSPMRSDDMKGRETSDGSRDYALRPSETCPKEPHICLNDASALCSDDPRDWPPEWRQIFDERYSIMLEDGRLHPNNAWPEALAITRHLYEQGKETT